MLFLLKNKILNLTRKDSGKICKYQNSKSTTWLKIIDFKSNPVVINPDQDLGYKFWPSQFKKKTKQNNIVFVKKIYSL